MVLQDPFSALHPVFRVSHGIMRNLCLATPDSVASSVAKRPSVYARAWA